MKVPVLLLTACFLGALNLSCVRTSTVLKVNKDGSGEITSRYFFAPQTLVMLDQLEALGGDGGLGGGLGNFGMLREIVFPEEESLKADAENFGEGVTYSAHEAGKDDENWEGYTVVYAVEDVRKVTIGQNAIPGKAREFIEASGQKISPDEGGELTFEMEGGTLTILSSIATSGVEGLVDDEQLKQAGQMGMKPSEAIKAGAATLDGMRTGVFVRIDGEIEETNAEHISGNLIIMSDAEIGTVLQDPAFGAFVDRMIEEPDFATPEALKELMKDVEGITVEMGEEVTVKFK